MQPPTPSPDSAFLDSKQQLALVREQARAYLKQNAVGAGVPHKAAQRTLSTSIPN